MNPNSKLLKAIFGISVIGATAGVVIYLFPGILSHSTLPDENVIAMFQANRATLERPRQMATEDLGTESYFSESRRQEYRQLITKIQHDVVVTTDYDETVRFIVASGELSAISPGWLKGIEYVPGNIEKKGALLPNLDDANKLPAGVYLREIQPHWFIVYQRTDD